MNVYKILHQFLTMTLGCRGDDGSVKWSTGPTPTLSSLPPELLIQIFAICSQTGGPYTPLTLCKVCKLWRDICVSSPRIWQLVIVHQHRRSIESIRAQAELWIAHSAPLPFHVEINLADFERLLPIISYFLPHISRWKGCTITFEDRSISTNLLDIATPSPGLILHHLGMRLKQPFDDEDEDEDDNIFSCGTSFRHVSMKITASSLPSAVLIYPLQFTSLDITETSFIHVARSHDLLMFLDRCPNLEHFYLHGVSYEEDHLTTRPPVVTLPRLHTLLLDHICIQRSILSHLYLPALRELHLRNLHMDFSLEGYHTEEEGDSDDEAHDFSQSPSSDHHTGMGLRRLIARSRPPLELLDMDLSDMRTKDFIWVFDRLPHLKEFSIVGSDMSDTVIRLLKPVPVESCTASGGEESGDGRRGTKRVRLPQMSSLKLHGCQQFSGQALVEALTERVHYTDTATPSETLTKVVISGCNGFTASHEHELSWHLHGRLYVS
ncbi:hypothetical protein F5I97DRAFT_1881381 [Phlebopus sp. FC_14]|nr:hypothetical protein F5I97DRAFT_1881381 [Phlebopus sp. FC_14]